MGDVETLLPGRFVGRDLEVSTVRRILGQGSRLLTLTGPPGVGKTRLATEVAAQVSSEYRDGVFFIDLSSARDAPTALGELARRLGAEMPPGAQARLVVHDWLHDKQALLVLDNAEQVLGLADEIPLLLAEDHAVQLMVTSRENLRLSMENEVSVPPLAMPQPSDVSDLARLAASPSVQLFAGEARAVQPDFEITADNAQAVADVCVRLDGLPLAIKLAAARVKLFSLADMATRLRDRRAILEASARDIPSRHRTLRAAITWSHALLDPDERIVFRRLSIFSSPWTFDAAEAVVAEPEIDVISVLSSLVDKSLLFRVPDREHTRLSMLESLCEYADEQLELHGERRVVATRHLTYCARMALESESSIGTDEELSWWEQVAYQERDAFAALDWAHATGDAESAAILATALGWYRYLRGHVGEGTELVERTRKLLVDKGFPAAEASAIALDVISGVLAWARGDLDHAEDVLEAATTGSIAIGDRRHEAIAVAFLGHVARERGLYDAARKYHEQAGQIYEELGTPRGLAWAKFDLARAAWQDGDLDSAAELLRDALTVFRDIDYTWAAAWTLWALGSVRLAQGDLDNGSPLLLSGLDLFVTTADRRGLASCLETFAITAQAKHKHADCLQLLSAAAQLRSSLAAPLSEAEHAAQQAAAEEAASALGDYEAEAAREAGRDLPLPAVVELARRVAAQLREDAVDSSGIDSSSDAADMLTAREREVARLIAGGHTNQQIGRKLGITARTAEAHVRNIMGKLDARSRSEVAVWAVTHGLHRA